MVVEEMAAAMVFVEHLVEEVFPYHWGQNLRGHLERVRPERPEFHPIETLQILLDLTLWGAQKARVVAAVLVLEVMSQPYKVVFLFSPGQFYYSLTK